MSTPITLPPLDIATLAKLRRRHEDTPNVESRTRYQMLLLAQQDYKVPQIARIVLRSEDTVARVLKRFLAGGLDAVPRRAPVLATCDIRPPNEAFENTFPRLSLLADSPNGG